jgi:hypothetical protein
LLLDGDTPSPPAPHVAVQSSAFMRGAFLIWARRSLYVLHFTAVKKSLQRDTFALSETARLYLSPASAGSDSPTCRGARRGMKQSRQAWGRADGFAVCGFRATLRRNAPGPFIYWRNSATRAAFSVYAERNHCHDTLGFRASTIGRGSFLFCVAVMTPRRFPPPWSFETAHVQRARRERVAEHARVF